MKIACIGGGPAGLYLGILVKRSAPEHDVVVYERNRPSDTFGFGVVFSDATLGHLAAADPETHAEITASFARWDDIEIHAGGEILRSTGHGFCGLERKQLLDILQRRAKALGVRVEFEHPITSLSEVTADVIVACDGVASWVRDALAAELAPRVDVRPNKFVWLGTTVPYRAFTFLFKQTPHGLYRVHAYRYHDQGSTFIVECRDDTWRAAGLATADEDTTVRILEDVFREELAGHRLIKNRSIWRNFPTVRCGKWHAGNVVLLGDAAHTAHFSIGSGTKLAMEDAIALSDELLSGGDIPGALAAYEAKRRPEVEALQAAAQASLEWFEGTERYMHMAPVQLTYSLMTRSLRVSHASVAKRDPHLARGVERLLAAKAGVTADPPPPPTALPFWPLTKSMSMRYGAPPEGEPRVVPHVKLLDLTKPGVTARPPLPTIARRHRRMSSRIAVAPVCGPVPDDDALVALGGAAAAGAGLVVTSTVPSLATDDEIVAWRRIVDYVQGKGALIGLRLASTGDVTAGAERAAFAGFDLLLLDPGDDPLAIEALPSVLSASRTKWTADAWLAAVVRDKPGARAAVVGHAAQLQRAGAELLWVSSPADGNARLPAATLADRLRNELRIPTCVDAGDALLPDLDAAIAAGRADLVVVDRYPAGAWRA